MRVRVQQNLWDHSFLQPHLPASWNCRFYEMSYDETEFKLNFGGRSVSRQSWERRIRRIIALAADRLIIDIQGPSVMWLLQARIPYWTPRLPGPLSLASRLQDSIELRQFSASRSDRFRRRGSVRPLASPTWSRTSSQRSDINRYARAVACWADLPVHENPHYCSFWQTSQSAIMALRRWVILARPQRIFFSNC